ncbi:MAG: MipA/OmpV family protein [Rhizobiaceae bacterium]|nr:MipA/OmpV family protein [Rhizobiaceae bacterium]
MRNGILTALSGLFVLSASPALADAWWSGDWYLKVGGSAFVAPRYQGDNSYLFQGTPMISLGRADQTVRFTSRNDNPSFSVYDNGAVRAGIVGKLILPRDKDTSSDLKGLDPVRLGVEAGVFTEVYPTDWMRIRAEVRRGIRSHDGIVADVAADAFTDVTDTVRLSAGPRLSFATKGYMDAYYGVDAKEAARSGLKKYKADGGIQSAGLGAAIDWKATEKVDTSLFAEYSRLTGPAADSSLVRERGNRNQFLIGVSATYRFDFHLD